MNATGRAATRYKSCAGPGFQELNHYKRHLQRVHLCHQCDRCGQIFDMPGELQTHLSRDLRCERLQFEPEGSISQSTWDHVEKVFTKRGKKQTGVSDKDRWFHSWDLLFPETPRPISPYYEDQSAQATYPLVFTRIQEVFGATLNSEPHMIQNPNLRDWVLETLRNAIEVGRRSTPFELENRNSDTSAQASQPNNNVDGNALDTTGLDTSEPPLPSLTITPAQISVDSRRSVDESNTYDNDQWLNGPLDSVDIPSMLGPEVVEDQPNMPFNFFDYPEF
ncbi:hypothetical protein F5X99DRAFT_172448 [Biscogniauxia marginata]|nr:hypothetical protein F5X99DRAFT_172448 [Biscogniauxia marginata]